MTTHRRTALIVFAIAVTTMRMPVRATSGTWVYKASMATPQTSPGYGALGGLVYAVGGWDAYHLCNYLNIVEAYYPAANSWHSRASMPTAREHAGVGVWNGKLYAVGGSTGCGPLTGANEAYDPVTNTWTSLQPMPTARSGHGVGVVNGILYALGGNSGKLVEAYDIAGNTWSTKAPMLVSRFGAAAAVVNGLLYVFGGLDYSANPAANTASVESYDPITNTWTLRSPMPAARNSAAAAVANGIIYEIGGFGNGLLASVLAYDPATNTWSDMPALNTARATPGAAAVGNVLYAFAGYTGDAYSQTSHFTSLEALTVAGNSTPVANAGPDQTVQAGASCSKAVTLNGSASSDADGDSLTYTWKQGATTLATTTDPTKTANVTLSGKGAHTITLTVTDSFGATATDYVVVTLNDVTPPVIGTVKATPASLWPELHKMVNVIVSAAVSDNCAPGATCKIISVGSNEAVSGLGVADRSPDWVITGNLTVQLRQEWSGSGSGRVYTITVQCTDASGNSSTKKVLVSVLRRGCGMCR